MDDFLAFVAVVVGLGLLVLPVVSFIVALRARSRIKALELVNSQQEDKLDYLYQRVRALEAAPKPTALAAPARAPEAARPPAPEPTEDA
ncbi:MAG: hypothetical protein KC933_10985, partial [Myxococcales bacterium]|nr:hypothetical protein [Myxococcales bacterium]